jgi:hypothetical protein
MFDWFLQKKSCPGRQLFHMQSTEQPSVCEAFLIYGDGSFKKRGVRGHLAGDKHRGGGPSKAKFSNIIPPKTIN